MRIIEVGMHWFPEGGGGADRYFHGLVSELVRDDSSARALFSVRVEAAMREAKSDSWEAGSSPCRSV